jgi:hypothetical protein
METKEKKSITLGQAIGVLVSIIASCILFYTSTQVRISSLEYRMGEKERVDVDYHNQLEKINTKLDRMGEQMFDIKVEVMKKADKKN